MAKLSFGQDAFNKHGVECTRPNISFFSSKSLLLFLGIGLEGVIFIHIRRVFEINLLFSRL